MFRDTSVDDITIVPTKLDNFIGLFAKLVIISLNTYKHVDFRALRLLFYWKFGTIRVVPVLQGGV